MAFTSKFLLVVSVEDTQILQSPTFSPHTQRTTVTGVYLISYLKTIMLRSTWRGLLLVYDMTHFKFFVHIGMFTFVWKFGGGYVYVWL